MKRLGYYFYRIHVNPLLRERVVKPVGRNRFHNARVWTKDFSVAVNFYVVPQLCLLSCLLSRVLCLGLFEKFVERGARYAQNARRFRFITMAMRQRRRRGVSVDLDEGTNKV